MRRKFGNFEVVLIAVAVLVIGNFVYIIHSLKEEGHRMDCASRERQLICSLLMYVQDNNECFPPADRWVPLLVDKYGVTGKAWNCPTTRYQGSEQHPEYLYIAGASSFLSGVEMGDIPDPIMTPVLADLKTPWKSLPYIEIGAPSDITQIISRVDPRHNGGAVFAFADGHVDWLAGQQVADAKTYQPCLIKKRVAPAQSKPERK
jgi:prepilin-type processing-associated H-X9-DG protein